MKIQLFHQMINTILFNADEQKGLNLQHVITNSCPRLKITRSVFLSKKCIRFIEKEQPKLAFLNISNEVSHYSNLFKSLNDNAVEIILIASNENYIFEAIKYKISGYLINPFDLELLKVTVDNVIGRISKKESLLHLKVPTKHKEIIGIPTIEGYEFITVSDIIRCESYFKCTRVITTRKSDIISSYNIGQFSKILEKYHFYSPHQSHLINLSKLKKYLKEGTIIMQDGSVIPVSRRRRAEFLSMIPCV